METSFGITPITTIGGHVSGGGTTSHSYWKWGYEITIYPFKPEPQQGIQKAGFCAAACDPITRPECLT